jgi:hypothetical protein
MGFRAQRPPVAERAENAALPANRGLLNHLQSHGVQRI